MTVRDATTPFDRVDFMLLAGAMMVDHRPRLHTASQALDPNRDEPPRLGALGY